MSRVLALVNGYPPRLMGGAEVTLHMLLVHLAEVGFDVQVLTNDTHAPTTASYFEIPVDRVTDRARVESAVADADLVISQLSALPDAYAMGLASGTPVVPYHHGPRTIEPLEGAKAPLEIYNSKALAMASSFDGQRAVLYPMVDPKEYRTTPGDRVTLINLGLWKGGNLFWKIVAGMPDHQFLAKRGGYSRQIVPEHLPNNVEMVTNEVGSTPHEMREGVYARTRILLIPSAFETWGRVGIEAAAPGIPVIAHPTDGLLESLGSAGIFVDREDLDGWVQAISDLDDEQHYRAKSRAMEERADVLWDDSRAQLGNVARLIREITDR